MPERPGFKELRERVALKWARRALAALAALTELQDSPPRQVGFDYDNHHSRFVRESVTYVPAVKGVISTPLLRQELTEATSLRTLYPQLAEHPSHSRARLEVLAALRAEAWRDLDGALRASANLARKRRQYPDAYVVEPFYGREQAPPSDRAVMSTTYVREVGFAPRIHLAPMILLERVVSWKVAEDPMPESLKRGIPTRSAMALERSADAFLRQHDAEEHKSDLLDAIEHGGPVEELPARPRLLRLDVVDRWTRQPTVTPDRVAFRGVSRRRVPSPVRYVTKPADGWSDPIWSASIDVVPWSCLEYRTDRVGSFTDEHVIYDAAGFVNFTDESTKPALGAYRPKIVVRSADHRHDFAWVGHRKIATGAAQREAKRSAKVKRQTAIKRGVVTGKRGIARTGWTLSDRSLTRAWSRADAGQVAFATILVNLLTTFDRGRVIEVGQGFRVMTDTATAVRVDEHGRPSRAFTHQAFARRAALAREDVA